LTPEAIEAILGDFRTWLNQLAAAGETPAPAATGELVDLHTLLAQFVALRQEVNLQTRATRAQQEQNTETLRRLAQALDALHQIQDEMHHPQPASSEEDLRPVLRVLIDLHDALALARREVLRVEDSLLPALDELKELPAAAVPLPAPAFEPPALAAAPAPPSFWQRLFGHGQSMQQQPPAAAEPQLDPSAELSARTEQLSARVRQLVTSIVTGYTMSVQRVERALEQFDLEPIPAVGEPFDPELMEAIEVVVEPGRLTTEVIEEVRRGYVRHGRVFRFAQVRVARPDPREPRTDNTCQ
jgi:molecular chaperone GrpE